MPLESLSAAITGQAPEEALLALSERLQEARRWSLMAELVSYISHELNQPLAAITSYAEACTRLLGESGADIGRVREVQGQIARQALRAGDLVRRLQLLLPVERVGLTAVDCALLLSEFMPLARPLARMRSVNLLCDVADDLPLVAGDSVQLQLLLLLLFHNALEAVNSSPSGRREVAVIASRAPDGVNLGVEDSGVGVPAEHAAMLFEIFFTTKPGRAGLGLAMSSSIAARHGAALRFARLPDNRTRFWVTLAAIAKEAD